MPVKFFVPPRAHSGQEGLFPGICTHAPPARNSLLVALFLCLSFRVCGPTIAFSVVVLFDHLCLRAFSFYISRRCSTPPRSSSATRTPVWPLSLTAPCRACARPGRRRGPWPVALHSDFSRPKNQRDTRGRSRTITSITIVLLPPLFVRWVQNTRCQVARAPCAALSPPQHTQGDKRVRSHSPCHACAPSLLRRA